MIIKKLSILSVSLVMLTCNNLYPQSRICGHILIDTTIWNPVIYLSLIPDFDKLNSMSNEMIIEESSINDKGGFTLKTQFLPDQDQFYRLHISKKSDPPASLIIGGKEENYLYFIANNKSDIQITDTSNQYLLKDVQIDGYNPNLLLQKVNEIATYLDSTKFDGSSIKIELIRGTINERLRSFADTCSNPIISLYALYKSNFDKNYSLNQSFYKNFLSKWKKEKSAYFVEFRNKIPVSRINNGFIITTLLIIAFLGGFFVSKFSIKLFKKSKNPIFELSAQERKIFALIIQGKSNKEISDQLNIGLSTVKSHINNLYAKLDISSRKDLLNLNLEMNDDLN